MRLEISLVSLLLASLACNTLLPASATRPTATAVSAVAARTPPASIDKVQPSATELPADTGTPVLDTPLPPPEGVRACDYDPLSSAPTEMPPEVVLVATPEPFVVEQPANTPVDTATTQRQLDVFDALVEIIDNEYVYIDPERLNWPALVEKYEAAISGGLTDEGFYLAMDNLIIELGDEHSDFEDPQEVIENDAETSGNSSYVGVACCCGPYPTPIAPW